MKEPSPIQPIDTVELRDRVTASIAAVFAKRLVSYGLKKFSITTDTMYEKVEITMSDKHYTITIDANNTVDPVTVTSTCSSIQRKKIKKLFSTQMFQDFVSASIIIKGGEAQYTNTEVAVHMVHDDRLVKGAKRIAEMSSSYLETKDIKDVSKRIIVEKYIAAVTKEAAAKIELAAKLALKDHDTKRDDNNIEEEV